MNIICVFIAIVYFNFKCFSCVNYGPVIGVLAQETQVWDKFRGQYKSYISASYVKAVESSGARVVPVFIDRDSKYYNNLIDNVNGFVFPGGSANITSDKGYAKAGRIIYDAVRKRNSAGDSIPILGVCLGMELLGYLSTGVDLRTPCPVRNDALSLKFVDGYNKSSLYKHASIEDLRTLSESNSTANHHRHCLLPSTVVSAKWNVLSTSKSTNSTTFISSMEMPDQPISALIFHPEKNAYEWNPKQRNPHDFKAISAARLFYDWLALQSVKNNHSYDQEQLNADLIYNYSPTFTGKHNGYDEQRYYFH